MIVVDTSGLLCLLDEGEPEHDRARLCVEAERGPLVTVDFVLAETDYLILKRLGRDAERAFLAQLLDGAILREVVTNGDLERAASVIERYSDQGIGLTDATVMAIAERLDSLRVLTLDRRHFAAFRDRRGRAIEVLPG